MEINDELRKQIIRENYRKNGKKGGLARAANMTKTQLSEAGSAAVAAREKKRKVLKHKSRKLSTRQS